jgi:hypothetical protein
MPNIRYVQGGMLHLTIKFRVLVMRTINGALYFGYACLESNQLACTSVLGTMNQVFLQFSQRCLLRKLFSFFGTV